MAKYHGIIGFVDSIETKPGVWEDEVVERPYFGEVIRNTKRWENTERLNDNLNVNNTISIISDGYMCSNLHTLRYISWMGSLWEISSIEFTRPRVTLSIGGVYNGPTPRTSEDA